MASDRSEQFAEALGYVLNGLPPEMALQAAGIDPATVTAEERERLEAAERDLLDELLRLIENAAETDPEAALWFRERETGD